VNLENPVQHAPLVSVLVTTFDHARYVEGALESLRQQTSRDFEVIITDDASTDGCADVIEAWLSRTSFSAQLIRNPVNRGICANRNAALARASGPFVCSLSGDEAYEPERIERQLQCFLTQPESVAAVYSDMRMVDVKGRSLGRSYLEWRLDGQAPPQTDLFTALLSRNFLPAPAVMVRRSAIAAVGGYDESLFYEDFDMWLRLSFRFSFVYLPGLLVRFRAHDDSMSTSSLNQHSMYRSRSKVLTKWVDAGLEDRGLAALLDSLLWNGAMQLRCGDSLGARESLDVIIRTDSRRERRWFACLGKLPGASMIVKLLAPGYRIFRKPRS
jgi:glycosyltransferase involved in cell wall biosynthesis